MNWVDKARRKAKIERLTKEVLNDPRYKKQRQEENREFLLKAYACLCLTTADYLFRNFGCREAGTKKFLDFAKQQEKYMEQDVDWLNALNEAMKDDVGFDVLEYMGMQAVED